jgi:hypothetical protein
MDINKIITDCHNIARGMAPKRSGNLRNNAIKITKRKSNGFTITYSAVDANYIKFVEEGTKNKDGSVRIQAQNFIEQTWINLSNYLHALDNGEEDLYKYSNREYKTIGKRELMSGNPDYRRAIHRQSILQHYQNEGRDTLYRKRGE